MKTRSMLHSFVLALFGLLLSMPNASYASGEVEKVRQATDVLRSIVSIPESGIPPYLLQNAYGVAIIPGLIKAGFVLGGRYGTGVVLVHEENSGWSNPVFISLAGGSIGWQIGVQSTDIILVFKSRRSIDGLISGKFTLGADASVAAGPVGRHAEASTDAQLRAEIYSYSRSRGLFAGISIEGAALQINYDANTSFYGRPGLLPSQIFIDDSLEAPPAAAELRALLDRYASRR